jgi:hypothetical protein
MVRGWQVRPYYETMAAFTEGALIIGSVYLVALIAGWLS